KTSVQINESISGRPLGDMVGIAGSTVPCMFAAYPNAKRILMCGEGHNIRYDDDTEAEYLGLWDTYLDIVTGGPYAPHEIIQGQIVCGTSFQPGNAGLRDSINVYFRDTFDPA